jgi:hypothetical protein
VIANHEWQMVGESQTISITRLRQEKEEFDEIKSKLGYSLYRKGLECREHDESFYVNSKQGKDNAILARNAASFLSSLPPAIPSSERSTM